MLKLVELGQSNSPSNAKPVAQNNSTQFNKNSNSIAAQNEYYTTNNKLLSPQKFYQQQQQQQQQQPTSNVAPQSVEPTKYMQQQQQQQQTPIAVNHPKSVVEKFISLTDSYLNNSRSLSEPRNNVDPNNVANDHTAGKQQQQQHQTQTPSTQLPPQVPLRENGHHHHHHHHHSNNYQKQPTNGLIHQNYYVQNNQMTPVNKSMQPASVETYDNLNDQHQAIVVTPISEEVISYQPIATHHQSRIDTKQKQQQQLQHHQLAYDQYTAYNRPQTVYQPNFTISTAPEREIKSADRDIVYYYNQQQQKPPAQHHTLPTPQQYQQQHQYHAQSYEPQHQQHKTGGGIKYGNALHLKTNGTPSNGILMGGLILTNGHKLNGSNHNQCQSLIDAAILSAANANASDIGNNVNKLDEYKGYKKFQPIAKTVLHPAQLNHQKLEQQQRSRSESLTPKVNEQFDATEAMTTELDDDITMASSCTVNNFTKLHHQQQTSSKKPSKQIEECINDVINQSASSIYLAADEMASLSGSNQSGSGLKITENHNSQFSDLERLLEGFNMNERDELDDDLSSLSSSSKLKMKQMQKQLKTLTDLVNQALISRDINQLASLAQYSMNQNLGYDSKSSLNMTNTTSRSDDCNKSINSTQTNSSNSSYLSELNSKTKSLKTDLSKLKLMHENFNSSFGDSMKSFIHQLNVTFFQIS